MMKTLYAIAMLLLGSLFFSCKREYSYEGGVHIFKAQGSLLDSVGNCMEIAVDGSYLQDTSLTTKNYIEVKANIASPGSYRMYTDTVNGYYFLDSGSVTHTGIQKFRLRGGGTPLSASSASFTVHFNSSFCSFTVPVDSADYRFGAPPNSCPVLTANGTYHAGATLNESDFVTVPIMVLQPGSYSIQTVMINNMLFSAKGVFPNRGNYLVTLKGEGKPANKGTSEVPLTIGGATCSFTVTVLLDTTMYWICTVEGETYRGLLDSDYSALPDTGVMVGSRRAFGCQMDGGDKNYLFTNYAFRVVVSRLDTSLIPGVYTPGIYFGGSDFNGFVELNTNINSANGGNFYDSDHGLQNFTVHLLKYDKATKLIEATFSGSVYKTTLYTQPPNAPVFQMTNGYFKTYMAHFH